MNKKTSFLLGGLIVSLALFVKIQPAVGSVAIPVLSSIIPDTIAQGQTLEVTIIGSNLAAQANFSGCGISLVSDRGVQLISCSVTNDLMMHAKFLASQGAVLGDRDIKISTIDSSSNTLPIHIMAPYVTVVSPNGGETLGTGKTYQIYWSGNIDDGAAYLFKKGADSNVDDKGAAIYISYIRNNTPNPIFWTIPETVPPGEYYVGLFLAPGAGDIRHDFSDASFSIIKTNTLSALSIIYPNGGETLTQSSTYAVRWSSAGLSGKNIRISLYKKDTTAAVIETIATVLADTGVYNWTVPADVAADLNFYKIAVISNSLTDGTPLSAVVDYSDRYFSIISPTNRPPDAPFNLTVASALAADGTVKLYWQNVNGEKFHIFKNKNDEAFQFLAATTDKFYKDVSGLSPEIKYGYYVTAVNSYGESQPSNKAYIYPSTTQPSIKVMYPNGGERWGIGKTYTISWTNTTGKFVQVQLAQGSAIRFSANIDSYPAKTMDSVSFTVPGTWDCVTACTSDYKVYVSALDDTGFDSSDAPFSVVAASSFSTPDSCFPDNTLLKLPDDPKVYVIINCEKKWIQTAEEFKGKGYNWSDVKETSSPVLQSYQDYVQAANLLRAVGQNRVYKIVNGKLIWVPTILAFNAQGLKWSDVQDVSDSQLNQYQRAKLLQVTDSTDVYYLTESGLKRHIVNEQVFASYNNNWNDVVNVTSTELAAYPDNNLIRQEGDSKVYKIENGQKHWVKTASTFSKLELDWTKIAPVNSTELNAYPDGAPLE